MSSYPRSNPVKSNRSVLNVSNGGPWNPILALKENGLSIKFEALDFVSEVSNKHAFKIWGKKRSEYFDHSSTLKALGNEDTLLRTYCCPWCFLGCANWETFVADTKCFWTKSETLFVSRTQNLCPQQMLRVRANGKTFVSATMCPRFPEPLATEEENQHRIKTLLVKNAMLIFLSFDGPKDRTVIALSTVFSTQIADFM